MTTDKPIFINRGYGKEKLCKTCNEYYPLNEQFFYTQPPSKQKGLIILYEGLCIPCYCTRKREYKRKAKEKKLNATSL